MNAVKINIALIVLCIAATAFLTVKLDQTERLEEQAAHISISCVQNSENIERLTKSRDRLREKLKRINDGKIDRKQYAAAAMRAECVQNMLRLENETLNGDTDRKIAYLTFDDGPYEKTAELLSILEEKNVAATFFVVGKPDKREQYKTAVEKGHTLGNHSYSHKIKGGVYESVEAFTDDITKLDDLVYDYTGLHTEVVRFPGGMATAKKLLSPITAALIDEGYSYVDWNCATMDGFSERITAEQAYNNAVGQARKHKLAVMLAHDYNDASLAALPEIIDTLRTENYIFLPLFKESAAVKHGIAENR